MTKTYTQTTDEVKRQWHLIDVSGKVLGRVSTEIAQLLIGKHKRTYTPHIEAGDYVVVINAAQVVVTGKKEEEKVYVSHSGFPGGLSRQSVGDVRAKNPEKLIERAVVNMLPKNKLRSIRMNRLKVYAGANHSHASQLAGAK